MRSWDLTPSSCWLHRESLSIKVMSRTFDRLPSWWRPTPTRNDSDSLLAMWTNLSLLMYRNNKKTNKTKCTLQALIAHSLSHALLRACRQVTGGTNTCYLLVSPPGAKVTPFSSRFSSQALHSHISRWSFSRSQEGHCCSGWGLQCSRISFLFHVWHDQGTAQLSQRDLTTSPMFGKLPAWKVPYPGDKRSDVAAPL